MNPVKRKVIVDMTAKQLNMPAAFIDEVMSFYYDSVQKKLSAADTTAVFVPKLGNFVVKKKALLDLVYKHQLFIRKLESAPAISVRMYEAVLNKRKDIAQLQTLGEMVEEEYKRKAEVKQKRKDYTDDKFN